MALTKADALAVWTVDAIPAPTGLDKTNPTWAPQSYLIYTHKAAVEARDQAKALRAEVAELRALVTQALAALPKP